MTLSLYHYVHCPFCVRVRMTLGYLRKDYQSIVVAYDDEKTPVDLIGKKMLPILSTETTKMGESLDIMEFLDSKNALNIQKMRMDSSFATFEEILSQVGNHVHSLAMPFWIWTPEFNESSRLYFKKKKEIKRGPFKNLLKNQEQFLRELAPLLSSIEHTLKPFYDSENFSAKDILLSAHLWGLYSVVEFQFSEKLHQYLQAVKSQCNFNYAEPFAEMI